MPRLDLPVVILPLIDTKQPVPIDMVIVHRLFIPDPQQDEQTARHPDRQPENVQKAIPFLPPETPESDLEEILYHLSSLTINWTFKRNKCCSYPPSFHREISSPPLPLLTFV